MRLSTFEQDGAVLPALELNAHTRTRGSWLGVALPMLALVNARLADIVTPELQRAEVLSGMAAVGLMLVAVLWTRADLSGTKA